MSAHIQPILMSMAVFFVLAMTFTAPWAIYQYRKHGYFNLWRNVILVSFIFYLLTAFFLVSLPLPAERHNFVPGQSQVYSQWHLFKFIEDIQRESAVNWLDVKTYSQLWGSSAFFQFLFNVLMLVPLGVYYRFYQRKNHPWWWVILLGFGLSLFFEISQRTALFGYYEVPYRLFDVDDLLANTLGAIFGYVAAPICLLIVPSRGQLNEQDEVYRDKAEASYGLQLVEVMLSLFISQLLTGLLEQMIGEVGPIQSLIYQTLMFTVLTVILPICYQGYTVGGIIVKLRLVSRNRSVKGYNYLKRVVIIYVPLWLGAGTKWLSDRPSDNVYLVVAQVLMFVGVSLLWLIIYGHVLITWIKGRSQPYFNKNSDLKAIRQ